MNPQGTPPMNVAAIIQARMASTRLPGKVLAEVGGRSMLEQVCRRVARAETIGRVLVATTTEPADEAIVAECGRIGLECFRGSEADVLDRYCRAAEAAEADVVVRITSDCPLIDPGVIDEVAGRFLAERPDYASNTLTRTWPRGLDTEAIAATALARAGRQATEPHQRSHVTPYVYEHPEAFRLLEVRGPGDNGDARWTVDQPEDLRFVREVYRRLGGSVTFTWEDVMGLVAREPALAEINRDVHQKSITEG